jgi:2,5-dihydroxypyridine 5,6-dioxygenase
MLPAFPPELLRGVRNCLINYGGIKKGDQVVILCELGTYIDPVVVQAQATICQEVGAEAQILWTKRLPNSWWEELSPTVRAAIGSADVVLQNMDTIGKTHMLDLMVDKKVRRIRNFASDVALMCSDWANFPVEVEDLVELKVNTRLQNAKTYRITSPAGTDISGDLEHTVRPWLNYKKRSHGPNVSFPPSVFKPKEPLNSRGVIACEATYPWGARRYGLPETDFNNAVMLTVEGNRIVHVEGGWEAERYKAALEDTARSIGDEAYEIDSWHSGMSPLAFTSFYPKVDADRWDHLMHNHENWFHFHIGVNIAKDFRKTQTVEHINAVCWNATAFVDGELFAKDGHLWVWDDPEVREVAKKYGDPNALFAAREVMK